MVRSTHGWLMLLAIGLLGPAAGANEEDSDKEDRRTLEERVADLEARLSEHQDEMEADDPSTLRAFWNGGLRFETRDKRFQAQVGGRIQNDYYWFDADNQLEAKAADSFEDGTEFRRARLFVAGTLHERWAFKAEYDFEDGDASFRDVWLALTGLDGVGSIKVGHFKEPFGLEELTSANDITFLERSLHNVFVPSRNTGVAIQNAVAEDRFNFAVGLFRPANDFGEGEGDGETNFTTRITGLPMLTDDGDLVHLGFGYSHQTPQSFTFIVPPVVFSRSGVLYATRPEVHTGPFFANTGVIFADQIDLINFEGAAVLGPFSVQGEWAFAWVEQQFAGAAQFDSAYIQATYTLTGEPRPYDQKKAAFKRIKPKENAFDDGGLGAWEVAGRFSYLDLNDSGVQGGRIRDYTAGLNWYANDAVRVSANYIFADPLTPGIAHLFVLRFQVAF